MPLLDISQVTRAITDFIARSVEISSAWQPRGRPNVSPLPPDQLQTAGLSFYLYHLSENPHLRTPVPIDPAAGHVRYGPMALDLYFQMSSEPAGATANDLLEAQLLMGLALKSLHDVPVIDDETRVAGAPILFGVGLSGQDNRFRITLQVVAPNDAVSYWTAGSRALRLAAYYQASVIVLEPEPITSRAGRVLRYGITTFVTGAPVLTRSETRISFTLPDGTVEEVEISPAIVPYGEELVLLGNDLSSEQTQLVLRGSDILRRVADPGWGLTDQPTRVVATVQTTIDSAPVVPGVYGASIRTTRIVDGRPLRQSSNETPIQIAPAVTLITPIAGGRFQVDGALFSGTGIADEDVEVFVGPDQLTRVGAAPAAGEFRVINANRIHLAPPATAISGDDMQLRILVNGAESPPRWIEVP